MRYENRRISCGEREGVGGGSHLGVLFESDECGFMAPLLFRGPQTQHLCDSDATLSHLPNPFFFYLLLVKKNVKPFLLL